MIFPLSFVLPFSYSSSPSSSSSPSFSSSSSALPCCSALTGPSYTVRISASTSTSTSTGQATLTFHEITITANRPPQHGVLSVQPTLGLAFLTLFSFSSSGWVDAASDYPLTYAFYYATSNATRPQLISAMSASASAASCLGQGLRTLGWVRFNDLYLSHSHTPALLVGTRSR